MLLTYVFTYMYVTEGIEYFTEGKEQSDKGKEHVPEGSRRVIERDTTYYISMYMRKPADCFYSADLLPLPPLAGGGGVFA
jgi:hypothetical protein